MKNGNAVTAELRAVISSREGKAFNRHGIVTKIMDGCAELAKTEKQKQAPLFR